MATTNWNLDTTHSELQFKVRHMMISNVTGHFHQFEAQITTEDDDFTKAKINFSAATDSVSTNNEQRDTHLKSPDFFDAAQHPKMTFVSTGVEKKDEENYVLHGNLSMHGISQPVTLNAEYGGVAKDPWGNERAGFTVDGKISRKDFGLTWNTALETGGVMVSDEVKIHAGIELVKGN